MSPFSKRTRTSSDYLSTDNSPQPQSPLRKKATGDFVLPSNKDNATIGGGGGVTPGRLELERREAETTSSGPSSDYMQKGG